MPSCRMLFTQLMLRADSLERLRVGSSRAASSATTAMTTSNSINVNAARTSGPISNGRLKRRIRMAASLSDSRHSELSDWQKQGHFGGTGFVYLNGRTSGTTWTSVVNLNGADVPLV